MPVGVRSQRSADLAASSIARIGRPRPEQRKRFDEPTPAARATGGKIAQPSSELDCRSRLDGVPAFLRAFGHRATLNIPLARGGARWQDERVQALRGVDRSAQASVASSARFAQARRPPLCPCGMGTIDQVRLGTLDVQRHFAHLRSLANRLIELGDAGRGVPSLLTRDGEPVPLALPLGEAGSRSYRVDLAATLFDRQPAQLSQFTACRP